MANSKLYFYDSGKIEVFRVTEYSGDLSGLDVFLPKTKTLTKMISNILQKALTFSVLISLPLLPQSVLYSEVHHTSDILYFLF